jgi:hypothetical protein
MLKRICLLLVLLLLFSAVVLPSRAQSVPSFSKLSVSLWPEFDRPELLVIYRLTLSSTTALPATLNMRIPAAAEVHAVAVGAREDLVGDVPFNRTVSGEWAEISFIATMPSVQFEYYDPGLAKDGSQRSASYRWPGDYAVEAMNMEVQEPIGSTGMRISPSLGTRQLRSEGLAYYTADLGSLAEGQSFTLSLEYQKADDRLSAEQLTVQPSEPGAQNPSGGLANGYLLPGAIALLGLALILGGGIWYWQTGNRREKVYERPRKQRSRSSSQSRPVDRPATRPVKQPPKAVDEPGVYCHQCGKRAGAADRFCRSCGVRLRVE